MTSVLESTVSRITDEILPVTKEWQQPLATAVCSERTVGFKGRLLFALISYEIFMFSL